MAKKENIIKKKDIKHNKAYWIYCSDSSSDSKDSFYYCSNCGEKAINTLTSYYPYIVGNSAIDNIK